VKNKRKLRKKLFCLPKTTSNKPYKARDDEDTLSLAQLEQLVSKMKQKIKDRKEAKLAEKARCSMSVSSKKN
jgi:hypothetical protein